MKNKTLLTTIVFTVITVYSVAQVKGKFTDSRDGNIYKTVKIGKQVWMAENLKYLPSVIGPVTGSDTIPYYYVYGYNGTDVAEAKATDNYRIFGVLYNWSSISCTLKQSRVEGICPKGWHVPSDNDWTTLIEYLGDYKAAGGKLKEAYSDSTYWDWDVNVTDASNESGFTALPGGERYSNGTFILIKSDARWWTTTDINTTSAFNLSMRYDENGIYTKIANKKSGFSVRCIKD